MNEGTPDLIVLASIEWVCDACGEKGELHLARGVDVMGLLTRLKLVHRAASPDCPKVVRGPSGYRQIDTPDGAVVNDPREIPPPAVVPRGRVATLLSSIAGAIAAPTPAPPESPRRTEHPPVTTTPVAPPMNPYSPEWRANARDAARARDAQSRLDAAEAKRARKADRRREGR